MAKTKVKLSIGTDTETLMDDAFEMTDKPEVVPTIDDLIGIKFPVLDDGFVTMIGVMGDDNAVVDAARISHGKQHHDSDKDRKLINYMLAHGHGTPFEMCEIKFHVRVPMDCWRQWIRHRTANVNEYSTRYSEAIDAAQVTAPYEWRSQSESNRQGSGEFFSREVGELLTKQEVKLQRQAREVYKTRLANGVAKEQARKDLPLSTYTEAIWKCDLRNLLHFLGLRLDSHAQYEIRQYAQAIAHIVKVWVPWTWSAFTNYQLHAMRLSAVDKSILACINADLPETAVSLAKDFGWLFKKGEKWLTSRECKEFEAKAKSIKVAIPWRNING